MLHKYYPKNTAPAVKVLDEKIPSVVNGSGNNQWIILKIVNTSSVRAKAELFDASGLANIKQGTASDSGIIITGLSTPYSALLNDLASGEQFKFAYSKASVNTGKESQFDNPWEVYKDNERSNTLTLVDTIYPNTFVNPNQNLPNLIVVMQALVVTRKTLLTIVMEPDTEMTISLCVSQVVQKG